MTQQGGRDYFATLKRTFPLATGTDPGEFKKTMDMLAANQKSKAALKALGKKPQPKEKPGLFQKLFDQRTGVLMAPARFGSALTLDVLGYKDPNLARGNPLESAIRSARGDFAITGGDVFKVQKGDSMGARLGKFAMAFAFDVATDPITYFGPVSIFSKKGAAVQAVRHGESMLSSAIRISGELGGRTDTLVDDLFRQSRIFQAADHQRRFAQAAKETRAGGARSALDDAVDEVVGTSAGTSPMDILGMTKDGVVSDEVKRRVAGAEMGRIIGESFLTGGRVRVRKQLTDMLGSEAAARRLFRELPQDLAGGMFLKTPTGRPLARAAGGQGGPGGMLGDISEGLASTRFAVSATGAGQWVSKYFGGQSGEVFAAVKKGLVKGLPGPDRTSLLDYTTYKKAVQERGMRENAFNLRTQAVLSTIVAARHSLGESNADAFNNWISTYFAQPKISLSASATPVEREAHAAAQRLRQEIVDVGEELRSAGLDIGDLGEGYTPLMLTKEEAERILKEEYRGIGLAGDAYRYTPTKTREAYVQVIPDPEVRARIGFDVPDVPDAVFLNAASINEILGRKAFETDPLKIAARYMEYAGSSLAARRFNEVALATGTLLRFPAESKKVYDALATAAFMSDATRTASPAARQKAQTLLERARNQLQEALSESELRKAQESMAAVQATALRQYNDAQAAVTAARQSLSAADRELAAATNQYENVLRQQTQTNLAQYAQTDMEQAVSEWTRIRGNASSRLSKAKRAAAEAEAEFNALANTELGPDAARAARERLEKMQDETISVEDARAQLAEAKAYRDQVLPQFVDRQMTAQAAAFNQYEQAVARRAQAVEVLANARAARDEAGKTVRASQRNTSLMRVKAVDALTDAYVQAKVEFDRVALSVGRKRVNDLPPEQAAQYRVAKAAFKEAKDLLFKTLGYSKKAKVRNAGTEYAETIVDLANKLSDSELVAARTMANADAMDEIVASLYGASDETVMSAIGDMVEVYKGIRNFLEPTDLAKLSAAERRVLSLDEDIVKLKNVTVDSLMKDGKPQVAAAGRAMYSPDGVRQIGASEAGANIVLPRTLEDVWAPNGVADILESFYRAREFPSEWERHLSKIYDPLLLVWKSSATVGRGPAYVMLNTVGGLANNFYARVSAKSHRMAGAMISETTQAVRRIRKAHPDKGYAEMIPLIEQELRRKFGTVNVNGVNIVDLYREFLDRGGHFSTDLAFQSRELQRVGLQAPEPISRVRGRPLITEGEENTFQQVANFLLTNPYQSMMTDMAQASELFIRFSAFVDGWSKFKNFDDAFDLTVMLHFDYQDFSAAEIWIKRFIPFYTWSRNNIPLQLRAAFTSMDQFGKLIKANAEFEQAFSTDDGWLNEYLPDYITQAGGFVSALRFGGNNLALFNKLPLADVDKLFEVTDVAGFPMIGVRTSEAINLVGPSVKTPIELLTQRNFQYGREYENFGEALKEQGGQLIPQWQLIKRTLSASGMNVDRERRVSNLFQLLVGAPYGMTTYTEKTLRGATYSQNIALSKQVRKAAEEAGVDVKWLRNEIAAGTPTHLLAIKISMGMGNAERIRLANRIQGRDVTRGRLDYNDILRGLEKGQLRTGYSSPGAA
jgi:hypothetical protein